MQSSSLYILWWDYSECWLDSKFLLSHFTHRPLSCHLLISLVHTTIACFGIAVFRSALSRHHCFHHWRSPMLIWLCYLILTFFWLPLKHRSVPYELLRDFQKQFTYLAWNRTAEIRHKWKEEEGRCFLAGIHKEQRLLICLHSSFHFFLEKKDILQFSLKHT